jgi:formamidopyrimidine-DNA glycosylase
MPELPEVETIVREMREEKIEGKVITQALVFWNRTIHGIAPDVFSKQIVGQKIKTIQRRGKYLVFQLSQDALLVHLRMTGKFIIIDPEEKVTSHERVRLILNDGRALRYEDQRKFGKWHLVHNPEQFLELLGLEPLSQEFTLKAFKECLNDSKTRIKPFLLDQKHISGLGNIYVDEALWEAKIDPRRPVNSLIKKEIEALYHAIPLVLKRGIANLGTSLGAKRANYFSVSGRRGGNQYQLNVFRRDGLLCPRCQANIIKITVAQRGTHLCPNCQK